MQKENPFWNSVRQIKIRCAKYKFAERSYNFWMQLSKQFIFGDRWYLDKLQTCAKGKSIMEFRSVWKEIQKNPKNWNRAKKYRKKRFDRAALWRVYVYLISSTSMQKENPFWNSVRQINIRCAKYKFTEGSYNFWMQLSMQLIFGDRWDLDKLQTCAKGKSSLEFFCVWKEMQNIQKIKTEQKKYQKRFDRATLWRVYAYLISSTSMQKENPFWNSIREIKICCAKYKFAERSHNLLIQLPIQLIFGDPWDLDKLQTCAKGKSILEFHSVWKEIQKIQKTKTEQKSTKNWFDRAVLWRVYVYLISSTSMQKENPFWNSVRQIKNQLRKIQICGPES